MHVSDRYLNLVKCSSVPKRRRSGRGEVISGEQWELFKKDNRIVMLREYNNQTFGYVDGDRAVVMDGLISHKDKKGGKTLPIDQEEERVDKTESSDKNYLVQEKWKRKANNNGGNIEKNQRVSGENGLKPPPEMPEEFRNKILELFGDYSILTEEFIMEKKTDDIDCFGPSNRLLIPIDLMKREFLEEDERKKLSLSVKILEPGLHLSELLVSNWNVGVQKMYTLARNWKGVVKRNKIVPGMTVQMFCVRLAHCFKQVGLKNLLVVLVNITPPDEKARLLELYAPATAVMEEEENGGGDSGTLADDEKSSSGLSSDTSEYYLSN